MELAGDDADLRCSVSVPVIPVGSLLQLRDYKVLEDVPRLSGDSGKENGSY